MYKVDSVSVTISARTRALCVLGYPVEHSVSPEMQNAALQAARLPYVYTAYSVPPDRLEPALMGLQALGFAGANLTIPHKEPAAKLVNEVSEEARALGAVNTVRFRDDVMEGHNTDVHGFLEPLRGLKTVIQGAQATVVGAGGAARAVVYGLLRSGASVTIINRTEQRARTLAEHMMRATGGSAVAAVAVGSDRAEAAVRESSILVNATSAGMHPREDELPGIEPEWLHSGMLVYDLIYRPRQTKLLALAERAGCQTLNGLPMLVHQGAQSLRLWLGIEPDVERMAEAARRALEDS